MNPDTRIGTLPRTVFACLALAVAFSSSPSWGVCTAGTPTANVVETTPTADFVINGDGTVTHLKTGLMWKQCEEGLSGADCSTGSATPLPWSNALALAVSANSASFAGYNDWRMPNLKELDSIVELCGVNPSINSAVFPNTAATVLWTASTYGPAPSQGWVIAFSSGRDNTSPKTTTNYVRLVRGGGQSVDAFDFLRPTYSLTYDGNGNTGGSPPVDAVAYRPGATATVRTQDTLIKSGSHFTSWSPTPNPTTTLSPGDTRVMDQNYRLYAQWAANVFYAVTYNGNGNTGGSAPTDGNAYAAGATVTVLANTGTLVKTGSTFAGWNTASDGSGTAYPATGSATFSIGAASVTLFAQWTVNNYTVTFNSNGGSVVVSQGIPYNTTATSPGAPTRAGFTFAGWYTDAGLTNAFSFATPIAASITLYAKWTPVTTFSVTYNGNGNTGGAVPTDAATYASGATVTVLANTGSLVKAGSTFSGWNTAANGSGTGYPATGSATFPMGAANVTLFAQWTINNYTVAFDSNGGSVVVSQSVPYNTTATLPGAPTRAGFTFAGWYSDAGLTNAFSFATPITASITLYAKWTPVATYGVTYNGNGNTGGTAPTDASTYAAGGTVTVLGNTGSLVKAGSIFVGWNTAANGTGTSYPATGSATFTIGSSAVTLYALWGGTGCVLDIDGNGAIDALTDGLLMLRAQFGLTGTAVTNDAIGSGATRTTWAQIRAFVNTNCGTNFAP